MLGDTFGNVASQQSIAISVTPSMTITSGIYLHDPATQNPMTVTANYSSPIRRRCITATPSFAPTPPPGISPIRA
jgi:hypothetical protein